MVEMCVPVKDNTLPVLVVYKEDDEDSSRDILFAVSCSS